VTTLLTCPTCGRRVEACDRCGRSLLGDRWASAATPAGHEHDHARCLTAAELSVDARALTLLFADWERTR
jgi:hypothetical protein